jgi:hypothetical protein
MSVTEYPSEFVRLSTQQTKSLNVVLCLDGITPCFSLQPTYTTLRYGDPDVFYGDPGLIYGGLRLLDSVSSVLSSETSLTISQRLEPEQGRASIQQMSFKLIDKNGSVSTALLTNGEILGRKVKVLAGYQDSSYPDDYLTVFRGMVTNVQFQTGTVLLTTGDLGQKRRTAIFRAKRTDLTAAIGAGDTAIPVENNEGFYDLAVDQSALPSTSWRVRPYLKIEDEYILYGYGAASGLATMNILQRGARGTTAVLHAINTEVQHAVELEDNAITLALEIMLSGNGDLSLPTPQAYGTVIDPALTPATNVILFGSAVDVQRDYGIVVGDSVTITGSASNDGTYTVTALGDAFDEPNRILYLSSSLSFESPAAGAVTFRSQFDVLPEQIGLSIPPSDVDIQGHIDIKNLYFSGSEYTLEIFVTSQQTGKDFIESQCYLPIGAYALTRLGRLSMGFTRPPLPGQRLIFVDETNVIEPNSISTARGLNNRKFFNEIQFEYDPNDAGQFQQVIRALDTDSLNEIGILSLLPIKSQGLKGGAGAQVANRVTRRLLGRYKKGAVEINLKTNFQAGSQIEAGDVIALVDEGTLQIQDFDTGSRSLGSMLLEVIDRSLDLKTGQTQLKLVTGLGTQLTDRYGTISPSSKIQASGTTTTRLRLKSSYGATTQSSKWGDYVGQQVVVHSPDWSVSGTTTFTQFSVTLPDTMEVSPALAFTPLENYEVDIISYPNTTTSTDAQLYKMIHSFFDPTLAVAAGSTPTVVQLSMADAAKCTAGQFVIVRNATWSIASVETKIASVGATSITLETSLGFTPALGQFVDLVGFIDGGGPYRFT